MSGETGHKEGLAESLEGIAAVDAGWGETRCAARLFAAADAVRDAADLPLHTDDRAILAPYLAAARTRLGPMAWAAAWAEGRTLSLDHAVAEAAAAALPTLPMHPA